MVIEEASVNRADIVVEVETGEEGLFFSCYSLFCY
jgi:hypothetical protein